MRATVKILKHLLLGAEVAMKLKVGMSVHYQINPTDGLVTTIESEPWKLGHGTWVVKVKGMTGGVDCGCIRIIEQPREYPLNKP